MKKKLLIASLIITSLSNAQSLTQANEPTIGSSATMYVCDSSFANFASTTGTGVTWNFSAITGYTNSTPKTLTVSAPVGSSFSPATKVSSIDGFISTYWNSTSSVRSSQGFVFSDPTVGDVTVHLSTNEEILATYPFAFSSTVSDTYAGTLTNATATAGSPIPLTGNNTVSIDGQGTLMLPGGITLSNVIRYKIIETSNATITVFGTTVNVTVIRTQFDYYDINNSLLPVFSHVNVDITGGSFSNNLTLVVSTVEPTQLVSISENTKIDFSMYPNPTQDKVFFKGSFSSDASLIVIDQAGRTVSSIDTLNNGTAVDLSGIEKGIYLVVITNYGVKTIKTISVN